jgi:NAD(P)-dependent dehydrogenase (short-subunit alcohol dehydrogenase family)
MTSNANQLKGKLAIVTGAGKPNGVGFAVAKILAEQGADVSIQSQTSTYILEE